MGFKDVMALIDGIIMKDRYVIIPEIPKTQVLDHLHTSHKGIEQTKLLACESICWANINDDIENVVKMYYMSYISADTIKGQADNKQYLSL